MNHEILLPLHPRLKLDSHNQYHHHHHQENQEHREKLELHRALDGLKELDQELDQERRWELDWERRWELDQERR